VASGLAIPLAFAALSGFNASKLRSFSLHRPHSFWAVALFSMLAVIWFGTATVDFYKPMPLLPRMFHPLLPTFCLTAGLAVEKSWHKQRTFLYLTLLFAVCAFLAQDDLWVMYTPLAVFFLGLLLWNKPWPQWLGLLAVAAVLCIRPTYFILKPTVSYYFEQKQIVDQHLHHPKGQYVVLMDSIMLGRHPYFYGFDVPKNYSFQKYAAYPNNKSAAADTVFLLINNGVLEHPELMMKEREKDILPLFPSAELRNQKGKVKLFVLPKDSLQ
jgi:hypothetical protein